MNDLTDKWKRGEFIICNAGKCQYYYVRNEEQQEVIKTEYCLFDDNTPNWQVLAPVPSYEEWKASYNCMLENEVLRLKNAQLKELLKECKRQFEEVELCRYDVADTDQEDWFKISTEQAGIANKMIAKIDEV